LAVNLTARLGAAESASIECLTFYIPSRDRHGHAFDQEPWIDEALEILSDIGGGATVLPPAEGAWLNPQTGVLIREQVVLAYTFVDPHRFVARLADVRGFAHRMGRETCQGEVVIEFAGRLYKIRKFDFS
jgi:hypothetical protein